MMRLMLAGPAKAGHYVIGVIVMLAATSASAATCESLKDARLAAATVTSAQTVAPGAFVPPVPARQGSAAARVYPALPSFCRVMATLTPSSDSDIKVEVWLPATGWNGKLQSVGNGGWTGSMPYAALADALAAGYATAGTDTGHVGNTASFALGHPEKLIDFSYRAVHEMTVQAKKVIDAFYGAAPKLSIWNGCSQGGRQGIAEAVRYPADYDAVIAGAPAVNFLHLHAGRMAINRSVNASPEGVIPPSKYPAIHKAVLAACDARDGVADGVIENPAACRFDPKKLQCKAGDDASCLTPAQVETARKMTAPIKNPRTGEVVLPGLAPGAELGWATLGSPRPLSFALEAYKHVIAKDADWDASRFDPRVDIDRALAADKDDGLGSTNPEMKAFFARGGKLLMYHGWSDPQVTPLNTVNFYKKVLAQHGKAIAGSSAQLYMVPGMNHCSGGPGTDTFDEVAAMEQWIATGHSPAFIPASHATAGVVDRTRPLCPYPQVARWNGRGNSSEGANFACVAP
jgi:feruloyl esterase